MTSVWHSTAEGRIVHEPIRVVRGRRGLYSEYDAARSEGAISRVCASAAGVGHPDAGNAPADRDAFARPAHETIKLIWQRWMDKGLVDEFSRIEAIKGQNRKGRGGRGHGIAHCP